MMVEEISITYNCRSCGHTMDAIQSCPDPFPIEDVYKHVYLKQCPKCFSLDAFDTSHIKCVIYENKSAAYKFKVECRSCGMTWYSACVLEGRKRLPSLQRFVREEMICMNDICDSRDIVLASYTAIN